MSNDLPLGHCYTVCHLECHRPGECHVCGQKFSAHGAPSLEPRYDWRKADALARQYVLGLLSGRAEQYEVRGEMSQRAYALRAAVMELSLLMPVKGGR